MSLRNQKVFFSCLTMTSILLFHDLFNTCLLIVHDFFMTSVFFVSKKLCFGLVITFKGSGTLCGGIFHGTVTPNNCSLVARIGHNLIKLFRYNVCTWLAYDLVVWTCLWIAHDLFITYDFLMTSSWIVCLFLQLFHDLFTICSWYVHALFPTPCSWIALIRM